MASMFLEASSLSSNPLDIAEQVVVRREWAFDRPIEDELVAEISGTWCNFRLWFTWQPDLGGMMFTCSYDMKIPKHSTTAIHALLALINERMWMGHFDLCSEDHSVLFRHGTLLRHTQPVSSEWMEEIMDIALEECERFYPAFQSVVWGGQSPEDAMKFSIFETMGEA
jgi:hypothetical protein